jgi:acetoin utilization deacetylase AcuC-like enzyme
MPHTGFFTHRVCTEHEMGSWHPECPERLAAIHDHLIATGISPHLEHHDAPAASVDTLARAHDARYIERLKTSVPQQGYRPVDPDTSMNPHTWDAALHSAGAVIDATDRVMRGELANAFCAVRPPGHHARKAAAMGFCFLNNVAIGALHAIDAHGLERVAVIDFDVHHGNGTEDILSNDERALMCSFFQHPFYPYSGTEDPAQNMVNVPLPAGAGSKQFRAAVTEKWIPALDKFRPELVIFSAGFDAHAEDDMAMLSLTDQDYAWVTQQVKAVADRHAGGRVVSMLEGGYALSALGRSVVQHLRVLAELDR